MTVLTSGSDAGPVRSDTDSPTRTSWRPVGDTSALPQARVIISAWEDDGAGHEVSSLLACCGRPAASGSLTLPLWSTNSPELGCAEQSSRACSTPASYRSRSTCGEGVNWWTADKARDGWSAVQSDFEDVKGWHPPANAPGAQPYRAELWVALNKSGAVLVFRND